VAASDSGSPSSLDPFGESLVEDFGGRLTGMLGRCSAEQLFGIGARITL